MSIFKIKYNDNGYTKIYILKNKIFQYKQKKLDRYLIEYQDWLYDLKNNKQSFVDITNKPFNRQENDIKLFAYYLPQFYPIAENNLAHGQGFTEWTNVASNFPYFIGHEQPKIPYDLGFYNLTQPGIIERQVELAKMYGIYGFCFYYYWFTGSKKPLEKPLSYFLKSKIDFKFHFCWANENWSRLWDGGNKEIILEQNTSHIDSKSFFYDILPYIEDDRYEKIDDRPILIIYNPTLYNKSIFLKFIEEINILANQHGLKDFFLLSSNFKSFDKPYEWKLEGIAEFPPHTMWNECKQVNKKFISNRVNFKVLTVKDYIKNKLFLKHNNYLTFKGCFPSWDNSPRKAYSNGVCFDIDDNDFKIWLTEIIKWTKQNNQKEHQYIYINAWNEWAEGAILEPTTRYGYKTLNIIKKTIEENRS